MKKILSLFGIMLLVSTSLFAAKKEIVLTPITPADGQTMVPNTKRGKRCPSRPVHCTVDTEQKSIAMDTDADIISYEIWDIDGNIQFHTSTSDYNTVDYLMTISEEVQLRIVSDGYIYIGYIDL